MSPTDTAPASSSPSDLAFFILVAKQGNLSAAARELNVTPSAVSKRLAQLENRLGVRLVNRTTRRISLTHEGESYLAGATRLLGEIREMEEQLAGARAVPRGLLRINATLGFGRTHIAPLVADYARRYPEVEVQLQLTHRPLDLVEEAFDLGIRFGELPDTRLTARRIMANRRRLLAAPAYLARHGRPETPADLTRHQCIIHRQNDDAYGVWRFTKGKEMETVKVRGALSSNDGDVVQNWALQGLGLVVRSEWDAAPLIAAGRLEVLLPDYALPPADLHAVYPERLHLSAKVRAFIDLLVGHFEGSGPS